MEIFFSCGISMYELKALKRSLIACINHNGMRIDKTNQGQL